MAKIKQIRNIEEVAMLQQKFHDISRRKMKDRTRLRRNKLISTRKRVKSEYRESIKVHCESESSSSVILKPKEKIKIYVVTRNFSNRSS